MLNVGAGAGSYEPDDRVVVAVEPAVTMIEQRPTISAPVARGVAERLPFADEAFDAALAVLTVHNWADLVAGLREMVRVSHGRQVVVTWDQQVAEDRFWFIRDYAPEMMPVERGKCPPMTTIARVFGSVTVAPLLIPADCRDGFFAAFWRRPEAYLDGTTRASISAFSLCDRWRYEDGLARLADDLSAGRWHERYGALLDCDELDLGYRIVTGHGPR